MHRSLPRVCALFAIAVFAIAAPHRPLDAQARERAVFVSFVDGKGNPVTDIRLEEIVVTEDRARREVLRVSKAVEPIDVALMVDNSTAAENHIVNIRDGVTRFIDAMHKGNNIALIGLADRPTILVDYTSSLERLKAGVGRIFAQPMSGMTLLDALVETSKGLQKRESARAAIVTVLTDGPELGHFDDGSVLKALAAGGAAFHPVMIGLFSAIQPEELRYRSIVLSKGVTESGGGQHTVLASTGIPQALEQVAQQLSSQQKVVYARPESLIPPEKVEVTVKRAGVTAQATPERRPGG